MSCLHVTTNATVYSRTNVIIPLIERKVIMAAVAPPVFVNMMAHQSSWRVILRNFGLAVRAIDRFIEDYETANDLMAS